MAAPPRFENIEIPERPAVASEPAVGSGTSRRRVLLYGGIAAVALIVLAVLALQWTGDKTKTARAPSEAPLIKAEEQPIKVSPESPGGMQVPNRDIMVYGRIHGAPDGKPPVERLLPEPERPLTPPAPKAPEAAKPAEQIPALPPAAESTTALPSPATPELHMPAPPAAPAVVAQPKVPAVPPVPPKPSAVAKPAETPKLAETAKPATPPKPATAATGRFQVQLFAGRSADEANAAWSKLKAKNNDVLGALASSVAKADLGDRGTFYRLRAGPIDTEAKAKALCATLSGRGTPCIIIRPGV